MANPDEPPDDAAAPWRQFKRQVKPLRRHPARRSTQSESAPTATPIVKPRRQWRALTSASPIAASTPVLPAIKLTPLSPRLPDDPALAEKLCRGALQPEARLDLHYHSEAAAHAAIQAFMQRARQSNARLLLIITGRGEVLRAAVPRWLQEGVWDRQIRWIQPAAARHGGVGAYYIVLRRLNSKDK